MSKIKITILGCGPSVGVPVMNCTNGAEWGACNPQNPKNFRTRASIAIEHNSKSVIIDTSPDLRQQLLHNPISPVEAVLYTHAHADHAHGIDDVRPLFFFDNNKECSIPIYSNKETIAELENKFSYLFERKKYSSLRLAAPILQSNILTPPTLFNLIDLEVIPFNQNHTTSTTIGYRIGDIAYSTDVKTLDDEAFKILEGVKVWIVDCLCYKESKTHSHLDQTLDWIKQVKPDRAILTHMKNTIDYDALKNNLPISIEPAYDGMVIEVN